MKLSVATKFTTLIGSLLLTAVCHADGFDCRPAEYEGDDLRVVIYNSTAAEVGTRTASKMVVSNPLLPRGERTLARFTAEEGNLKSAADGEGTLTVTGKVDLRFKNIKKDEYLIGAALADTDNLIVRLDFKYGANLANGEELRGTFDMVSRGGSHRTRKLVCVRYLKGE